MTTSHSQPLIGAIEEDVEVPLQQMTYAAAIRQVLQEEMRKDERIFLIGEDIGIYGGAFGVTRGLLEEFGEERVRDTPISEQAIRQLTPLNMCGHRSGERDRRTSRQPGHAEPPFPIGDDLPHRLEPGTE